jgi:hypothetical protein
MKRKWTKLDRFFAVPLGDLGNWDETVRFKWPIAADYVEKIKGEIHAVGFKEHSLPLDDPDLFSSLAHLSENGEPSMARILRWVRKHGLLTREKFVDTHNMEDYCGDSISLEEFRAESRQAHDTLTLFKALKLNNASMVQPYIRTERIQEIDYYDRPKGPKGKYANAHVFSDYAAEPGERHTDANHVVEHEQELTDGEVLSVALSALQARIREKVDLELRFEPNFEHPHPLGGLYRPVPVLMPRSLLGAAWLQILLYVADFNREWRLCVACGRPFKVTRNDQTTCPGSAACQKKRQRSGMAKG